MSNQDSNNDCPFEGGTLIDQNSDPMARAKGLATSAANRMAAVIASADNDNGAHGPALSDYQRARLSYEASRQANRLNGLARAAAHNQNLHEQAAIRRHGGYQIEMFG